MRHLVKRTAPSFKTIPSFFDDLFLSDNFKNHNANGQFPSVNIKDEEKAFTLEFALPGYKKEDLSIEIENDMLVISSEKNTEEQVEEDGYTRKEFSYSSFSRSFTLPEIIDLDKIDAHTKDGVLSVILPKKDEVLKNKVKKISIQ